VVLILASLFGNAQLKPGAHSSGSTHDDFESDQEA
jgi:hypothetical protein